MSLAFHVAYPLGMGRLWVRSSAVVPFCLYPVVVRMAIELKYCNTPALGIQKPPTDTEHFHSFNHQKWLTFQILGGKPVKNVQIDPNTAEECCKKLTVTCLSESMTSIFITELLKIRFMRTKLLCNFKCLSDTHGIGHTLNSQLLSKKDRRFFYEDFLDYGWKAKFFSPSYLHSSFSTFNSIYVTLGYIRVKKRVPRRVRGWALYI